MKDLQQSIFILIAILFSVFGDSNGSLDEICQSGENNCNIQFSFNICVLMYPIKCFRALKSHQHCTKVVSHHGQICLNKKYSK